MSEFTAKKLKEARMKAEITQDEAAALMNVTRRAISEGIVILKTSSSNSLGFPPSEKIGVYLYKLITPEPIVSVLPILAKNL